MPTEENSLPEDELYPFDDETEDEAQRSAERPDSPPGPVVPDDGKKIARPREEDEPEGGAGDSDIERGTR